MQFPDLLQEVWILNTGLLGIFVCASLIAETEVENRLDPAAANAEVNKLRSHEGNLRRIAFAWMLRRDLRYDPIGGDYVEYIQAFNGG